MMNENTNRVLFVSHKKAQCGVYEFGKNITDTLQYSNRYQFVPIECSSLAELQTAIAEHKPSAIIYNYMPAVMPWVATEIAPTMYISNIASIKIPQIGIIHDVTQYVADTATNYKNKFFFNFQYSLINSLFDFYIAPDPTLLLLNPIVFKTGRLIPSYQNNFPLQSKPVIGSFGFGTPNKGFDKIIQLVQQEYNEALLRFNIPAADFGDKYGDNARAIAEKCKALISKSGIQIQITHDFLEDKAILDFLAQNTVNVFLYEDKNDRGLSSTIDYALAVQRPVAVSDSVMFRHLFDVEPPVCITRSNLRTISQNGFAPLQKHYNEWNAENLLWEYERILDSVFVKQKTQPINETNILSAMQLKWRRLLAKPYKTFTWLRSSEKMTQDEIKVNTSVQYQPVQIPINVPLNRILDNKARELYRPAISKLKELTPKTMANKIEEANVQQAFVFDTVYRYIPRYNNPKLLCVGCYEDTASMSLRIMGHPIEEIDPMINYYLQEYLTKPTTVRNSYDIVFATSVIEHDPDDESFVKCIAALLAPGGMAVITCDYKDGWKPNEPKPEGNARFYTQEDLRSRLLPLMKDCHLIDEPQWNCPNPDFNYLGRYQYTFATFVVKKSD